MRCTEKFWSKGHPYALVSWLREKREKLPIKEVFIEKMILNALITLNNSHYNIPVPNFVLPE